jgi:hypothetical protein
MFRDPETGSNFWGSVRSSISLGGIIVQVNRISLKRVHANRDDIPETSSDSRA